MLAGVAVIWVKDGDTQGWLILIIAGIFIYSARQSWLRHLDLTAIATGRSAPQASGVEASITTEPEAIDPDAKEKAVKRLLKSKRSGPGQESIRDEPADQAPSDDSNRTMQTEGPSPEGFLSQFGQDDEPG